MAKQIKAPKIEVEKRLEISMDIGKILNDNKVEIFQKIKLIGYMFQNAAEKAVMKNFAQQWMVEHPRSKKV